MLYHKNKQQAFQAAQQGTLQAVEGYHEIVRESPNYAEQLHHVKHEVQEAFEQINNALEVASEKQRTQLMQYQDNLQEILNNLE